MATPPGGSGTRQETNMIFYTGDLPLQSLFSAQADNIYGSLPFSQNEAMWGGCIDAPDAMPAGSTRLATIDRDEAYATPRYARRPA